KTCVLKRNLQSGSVFSSPVISLDPHIIFVSTLEGCLFSLKPLDGSTVWKYDFHKPLFMTPCLTSKGILVGCVDSCLYHINNQGALLWKKDTDGPIFSSPITIPINEVCSSRQERRIICASYSHFIFCFSIDGELLWKTNLYSKIYAKPCLIKNLHTLKLKDP
ncbi:hypothetical protein Ahia01_000744700, partial [Argonauta hians]